jgi:branched-chain amino acid transport system permease protein
VAHASEHLTRRDWIVWVVFALVLLVVPLLWRSSFAQTMLSQIGIAIIACLAYNMLLGQGGMLSFGHAVYSGLGSFIAIHALNMASKGHLGIPVSLMPLVGGLAGLFFAAILGYVTTKKSGTTFAMITLGIGELVASMSLMIPEFFGGEGGIQGNRVFGKPVLGITFGPQIQVYYLIAVYCFISTAAMYALTRTPLGRMLNAVRDNPERVEFVGYSTQHVRYIAFMISGFFAGWPCRAELNVTAEWWRARSALTCCSWSSGATSLLRPIIGAVMLVIALVLLSELTKAWLLYLGIVFLIMVMYAPGGIASLIMVNMRVAVFGKLNRLWVHYVRLVLAGLVALAGAAAMIEMVYQLQLNEALGPEMLFLGLTLDADGVGTWVAAVAVFAVGVALFEWLRRGFQREWSRIQEEIAAEIQRREAVA